MKKRIKIIKTNFEIHENFMACHDMLFILNIVSQKSFQVPFATFATAISDSVICFADSLNKKLHIIFFCDFFVRICTKIQQRHNVKAI